MVKANAGEYGMIFPVVGIKGKDHGWRKVGLMYGNDLPFGQDEHLVSVLNGDGSTAREGAKGGEDTPMTSKVKGGKS